MIETEMLESLERHKTQDEFFHDIERIFKQIANGGSVFMTQKPVTVPTDFFGTSENADPSETLRGILIRAKTKSNDAPLKTSTIVSPTELAQFFSRYTDICKTSMAALKKRDRSKQKKSKSKKKKPTAAA